MAQSTEVEVKVESVDIKGDLLVQVTQDLLDGLKESSSYAQKDENCTHNAVVEAETLPKKEKCDTDAATSLPTETLMQSSTSDETAKTVPPGEVEGVSNPQRASPPLAQETSDAVDDEKDNFESQVEDAFSTPDLVASGRWNSSDRRDPSPQVVGINHGKDFGSALTDDFSKRKGDQASDGTESWQVVSPDVSEAQGDDTRDCVDDQTQSGDHDVLSKNTDAPCQYNVELTRSDDVATKISDSESSFSKLHTIEGHDARKAITIPSI